MNTNRINIQKSKTREVRKAVTENLEIRYQDYANPPLKKIVNGIIMITMIMKILNLIKLIFKNQK